MRHNIFHWQVSVNIISYMNYSAEFERCLKKGNLFFLFL